MRLADPSRFTSRRSASELVVPLRHATSVVSLHVAGHLPSPMVGDVRPRPPDECQTRFQDVALTSQLGDI